MKNCKFCIALCDDAGVDQMRCCKKYKPSHCHVIKTDNILAFPERIEVVSSKSRKKIVFTPEE